jgi:acetylornithine deacetylase
MLRAVNGPFNCPFQNGLGATPISSATRTVIDAALAALLDEAVEARREGAFDLLERLVAEPSELGDEAGATAVVERELADLGFTTAVLPIPAEITADPAAGVPQLPYEGRGPLVARMPAASPASTARSLLLNGHLDVVPPGGGRAWTGHPYRPRRDAGWMLGRGAADMKGGIVMALLSIGAFLDVLRTATGADIVFVGAIEEECTGNGTLATVRADVVADAVVLTESTGLDLMTAGLGVLWIELVVHTRGGHAETAGAATSALDLAAEMLPALRRLAPDPEEPDGVRYRANVGRITAGDWPSSVPATATIDLRVGFPADWTPEQAEDWVRERIAAVVDAQPGLDADQVTVRPSGMRAAGYALAPDSELVAALQAAHHAAHGAIPAITATEATTDARFYLNQAGVPAVCFGPRARALHAGDEAVELESIIQGARTLVRFMTGWLVPEPARAGARRRPSKEGA